MEIHLLTCAELVQNLGGYAQRFGVRKVLTLVLANIVAEIMRGGDVGAVHNNVALGFAMVHLSVLLAGQALFVVEIARVALFVSLGIVVMVNGDLG